MRPAGVPARWRMLPHDPAQASRLSAHLGLTPPAARVLAARGYAEPDSARRFLEAPLADLHDPFALKGMREALARLRQAIASRESILLYGDYDVDGAASLVMLRKAIELAGHQAAVYVPHRLREGYGLHPEAIERAAAGGVRLLFSLDTGVRAHEAVRRARQLGLDVIVADHHLPDRELPPALAVLNPRQPDCCYPEKNLCAAGVTFKLVQALLSSLGWPSSKLLRMLESFLKLAAIATVADVAPLTGENRIIVKHGLEGLRSVRNPGLRELLKVAGFAEGEALTAEQVAFRLAPRLNAAGRMADAIEGVNLLLAEDEARARELAARLHTLNRRRQDAETESIRSILEECLRTPVTEQDAALVFSGPEFHRGVVGIVAGRLVERFHRPVFVLGEDPVQGLAQGSGRSIPAFHLLEALEAMPDLFLRYGGHRQAAGVTLPAERVEEFRRRLNAYAAARLKPEDFRPELELDASLGLSELNERAAAELLRLAPFGFGNPPPRFLISAAEVAAPPAVFKERHLRVCLRQGERLLSLKAWGFAERASELAPGARVDAAVAFEPDSFSAQRGGPGWSAVLEDVRPAQPSV